jgi:hypothetical protein
MPRSRRAGTRHDSHNNRHKKRPHPPRFDRQKHSLTAEVCSFNPDAPAGRVITFITTGGGGAPLAGSVQNAVLAKTASTYEYCAVTADATTFRISAFESSGKPLDALTIGKKNGKYDKAYLDQAIPMDEAIKATSSGGGGKAAP